MSRKPWWASLKDSCIRLAFYQAAFMTVLLPSASTLAQGSTPGICPTGVVAWWTGSSSGTTALDASPSVHHGSMQSGATSVASGMVGTALYFDGNDDEVRVNHASDLTFPGRSLTIEGWIKAGPVSNYTGIIGKITALEPRPGWLMYISPENQRLYCYMGLSHTGAFGTDWVSLASGSAVATDQWYHVACTYDGATLRVYVNGALSSSTLYSGGFGAATEPLLLGNDIALASAYGNRHYPGLLDEMTLYSRALTGMEICEIHAAGSAGKCSSAPRQDADGDGLSDTCDSCPSDPSNDADRDGLCGNLDNCPDAYNPGQTDSDGDGRGDTCDPSDGPPATWIPTSPLACGRILHTATLLRGGQVLVTGGYNKSTEVYDPATGTWARRGDTRTTHRYHTATLLEDGRVLVAGGDGASATASAELYNPAAGSWSATTNLLTYRRHHAAVRLAGGRVLVMGGLDSSGRPLASAEVFDPATSVWTATGSMREARSDFTATLLNNGSVLVAGGYRSGRLASAELYNPATGTWTAVTSMTQERGFHAAALLADGRVLVTGGARDGALAATSEIYDPASGRWSATGSMAQPRRYHTTTPLQTGLVLVAGGYDNTTGTHTSSELYDPSTGRWTPTSSMAVERYGHTATLLNDGRVLAAGGFSTVDQASVELFGVANYPRSCLELKRNQPALGNGTYTLDPCRAGPSSYYCDMTTEGGGWTVAGWQAASAKTNLGVSTWGTLGSEAWSKKLACVPYSEIRVFNRTYGEGFSRTYPASTWPDTTTNMAIGTAGTAFKQGTYGPSSSLIMMGCIDYSYNAGVQPQWACDSDWQTGPKGHLADYAGEFCPGARLDHTWAWSTGTTCKYRGVPYTWGFAIR